MDDRRQRFVLLGEQAAQTALSRRGLLKGVVAAGAMALLAACGSTAATSVPAGGASVAPTASSAPAASTSPAPSSGGASGSTTVTWFAARDTSGYTPMQVEAFNNANKSIRIDYQEQGSQTTDLHDKFVTVASAKDPSVDLISMDVPYVPEFAAAGWTISMDDALPQADRAAFFQGTLDGATVNGKLFAIPWYNNGPGLYYRKDLLEAKGLAVPKSYDDLLNAAKQLQTADISGYALQLPQNEGGIISWMEYLWGYGGDLVDTKNTVTVDQGTAGVQGMQKLVDFIYKDKIIPEAALQFKLGADVMNLFRGGKAVFIRLWFSSAGDLYKPDTTIKTEQWGVGPLPSGDGKAAGPGCLGTWNLGVSAFSKKQQQATDAVKLLTNQDNQKQRFLGNGNLPSRSAIFDDAEIQKKYPYAKSAQASFASLKPRPVTPYYPQMSADAIQPAFGQAMAQQLKPDAAIKQMADKMRAILKS